MQGHLTRFPTDRRACSPSTTRRRSAAISPPSSSAAASIIITSVDGAPDIEAALKGNTLVQASASQDPYVIAQKAVEVGYEIMNGKKPAEPMILLPSTLITRDNVGDYKGWSAPR